MADSAQQVRRVVARLRRRGFTVIEVTGWERRGKGPMTTRGRVEHHTATPRTARGDAPTLRVVTHGHGSLQNSLCRYYVSRSGTIYLVALNTSWHAGRGIKGTNSTLSGTEAEHSGTTSEQWTEASLDAQAAISQEEAREFAFPVTHVWEHKEHAPGRKSDRANISGPAWRQRLAAPSEEFIVRPEDEQAIRTLIREEVGRAVAMYRLPDNGTGDGLDGQTLQTAWRATYGLAKTGDNHHRRVRRTVRAIGLKLGLTRDEIDA